MLRGPMRLAQTALACVCTTAFGRLVVPDVNMIPKGSIGSRRARVEVGGVAEQVVERVEPVRGLVGARGLAAVVVGDRDPLQGRCRGARPSPRTAAG